MQSIARLQTPYKLPQPVLEPSRRPGAYDSVSVDVPFVFSHNDRFYMLHVGFDGRGYQTALAAAEYPTGTELTLTGRLQSRTYLKNLGETSETRTAYEFSVSACERVPEFAIF